MGFLIVIIAAVLGWAIWKDKLRKQQIPPLFLGFAGAFFVARGNPVIGVAAVGIALAWYRGLTWRLSSTSIDESDQSAIDKARFMLGVSRFDNAEYIKKRHRALIAKNHPDTGGSEDRARELNQARDLLLRDLKDKLR
jgi:hypothetical protein